MNSGDFFPNGCLPSIEVIARQVAPPQPTCGWSTSRTSRPTTPRPCGAGANVDAGEERQRALGYDERFMRLWRLYLSFCEAGFTERRIGNVQVCSPSLAGAVISPPPRPPPASAVSGVGA